MTDKELLELAAKAAGYGEVWYVEGSDTAYVGPKYVFGEPIRYKLFNPLTDDGDALRLAVKLGITASPGSQTELARSRFVIALYPSGELLEERGDDPYAATRRAIVRAAAAIGEQMP